MFNVCIEDFTLLISVHQEEFLYSENDLSQNNGKQTKDKNSIVGLYGGPVNRPIETLRSSS